MRIQKIKIDGAVDDSMCVCLPRTPQRKKDV